MNFKTFSFHRFLLSISLLIISDDFKDENLGYATFIDVPSFIDFFLLNEFLKKPII